MRTAADGMKMVGTYNGTPVPVAAACATLAELSARAGSCTRGSRRCPASWPAGLRSLGARHGAPLVVQQVGARPAAAVGHSGSRRARTPRRAGPTAPRSGQLSELLVEQGVNSLARGLWFVSAAHGAEDVERTLAAADRALARMPAGVRA